MEEMDFPEVLYENFLRDMNGVKFTPREIEIMAFLLNGRSGKKIAAFLSISPKTVENHAHNIMEKIGCNSREGIIDFVENSGKFLFLKRYYLSWFIHSEFEGILKKLPLLNEKLTCALVWWSVGKKEYTFLPALKSHLTLAGVKVTLDRHQKVQSLSSLLSEPIDGMYKIYLLPKIILEETHPLPHHHSPVKTPFPKLFILPVRDFPHSWPVGLPDWAFLDLTRCTNYYFLVFDILKWLFAKQPIEEFILNFQQKTAAFNFSHPKEKPPFPHFENSLSKGRETSKRTSDKLLGRREYGAILIFLCLINIPLMFHFFFSSPQINPLYPSKYPLQCKEHGQRLVRSEGVIPPDPTLLDRREWLTRLENQFQHPSKNIPTVVLTGIGGSGKTILARQYARLQNAPIVWELKAESPETLWVSFENLAQALAQTEEDKREIKAIQEIKNPPEKKDKIVQWVQKRLFLSKSWFLVYDNVVNFKSIEKYFPSDQNTWGRGQVLITTRNSQMQNTNIPSILPLKELSDTQKLDLFTKILLKDSGVPSMTSSQLKEAKKFLKEIPPYPLDVSIAAYYLKRTNVPYSRYLSYLKEYDADFETLQKDFLEEMGDYHKTRYSIIALSLKETLEIHKDFKELLLFISLLNSQDIPRELLAGLKKEVIVDKFIHHLKTYFLINEAPSFQEQAFLSVHPSIQENCLIYLKKTGKLNKNNGLLKPLAHTLESYIEEVIQKQNFHALPNLANHGRAFLGHADFLSDETRILIGGELGNIDLQLSNYEQGQEILEKTLGCLHQARSPDQERMARFSVYLADGYRETGNYQRAKTLLEESLHIYRSHFPESHKRLAMTLAHLGAVYRYLGVLKKSRDLLEEGVALYQKHSLDHQPDFAWALVHLGNTYREIGSLSKATNLLEKSLSLYIREFSKNHPTTAWNMAQLGNMYREGGKYEKATSLLEESLLIYERHFPYSHDRMAWNLTHLGDAYTYLGDPTQAITALEKALSIHDKYFSKNHAGVARTLLCLGNAYRASGDYPKAKEMLEKSLKAHLRYFSEKHVRLAPVYMNLGMVHRDLGHYAEAKALLHKSLNLYEQSEGKHLMERAGVLRGLGSLELLEGHLESAEKLFRQSIEIAQLSDHPDLFKTWEALADLYLKKSTQVSEAGQQETYRKQASDCLTQALQVVTTSLSQNKHHTARIQKKRASIKTGSSEVPGHLSL